jgi:hypothetical protein
VTVNAETITVTRHADGTVTADYFPDCALVSLELLAFADPTLLHVRWEGLFVAILGVEYVISEVDHGPGLATLIKRGDS